MTLLETRALGKFFGGLAAVDDVSIDVSAGSVVGVIGPNGAGKSTLVELVSGHLRPTSGRVLLDGRDVTGARPWQMAAAGVARTFQVAQQFRGLTVRENVAVALMHRPLRPRSVSAALALADQALDELGLVDCHDRLPRELSVAQLRRLELARALALRPRLLMLDEVLAGLHGEETDSLIALIRGLAADGMAVMIIEHQMDAILAVCDEVLVLHHGQLLMQGTVGEVLSDARVIEAYLGRRYIRTGGWR